MMQQRRKYYIDLFVVADGRDSDGLTEGLAPLFERDDLTASLVKRFDYAAVVTQILAKILHLLQQLFSFIQCEFALAVRAVEQLVLAVKKKKESIKGDE